MILGVLSKFSESSRLVLDRRGGALPGYNTNLAVSPPRHVQLTVARHLRTVPRIGTNKILY